MGRREGSLSAVVLVPVKAFSASKARLATVLDPTEREALSRRMAERVLAAATPLATAVVCDDDAVAEWAALQGAQVIWTPGLGLNGAVAEGVAVLGRQGVERIVVSHADLPLAEGLSKLAEGTGVTLVPDRHHDGTNVLVVPADASFSFAYGPGSMHRHVAEATRLGLAVRIVDAPLLAWDVDLPGDLDIPEELTATAAASPT